MKVDWMLLEPDRHGASDQSWCLQFDQLIHGLERCGTPSRGIPRKCEPECAHQSLKRQIRGTTRHRVVTNINQPSRLEVTVDEAPQGSLTLLIYPRIDAVGHDVIESLEVGFDRSREVCSMEFNIFDCAFGRKTLSIFDVRRQDIDTAKASCRMCRSENCRGHTLSTAEVAPGKSVNSRRRRKARYQSYVIKPCRRQ